MTLVSQTMTLVVQTLMQLTKLSRHGARNRIPCGPVKNLDDPQVRQRGLLDAVTLDGEDRAVPLAHMPLRLGELTRQSLRPAPRLGEHTDEILTSVLGYEGDELERVHGSGAVGDVKAEAAE